jgi:hypothetical protein
LAPNPRLARHQTQIPKKLMTCSSADRLIDRVLIALTW